MHPANLQAWMLDKRTPLVLILSAPHADELMRSERAGDGGAGMARYMEERFGPAYSQPLERREAPTELVVDFDERFGQSPLIVSADSALGLHALHYREKRGRQ
jgi:hypothetical protein